MIKVVNNDNDYLRMCGDIHLQIAANLLAHPISKIMPCGDIFTINFDTRPSDIAGFMAKKVRHSISHFICDCPPFDKDSCYFGKALPEIPNDYRLKKT